MHVTYRLFLFLNLCNLYIYMKRTLLLLPAIACLSLSVFAQVPVDKTVSLQSVEIQGKRFGGLTGGEVKRLQVDSNLSGLTGTTPTYSACCLPL